LEGKLRGGDISLTLQDLEDILDLLEIAEAHDSVSLRVLGIFLVVSQNEIEGSF
jgi:hypothetical protein